MVKHTQTISRQKPMNCFSVLDYFVGLAFKELGIVLRPTLPFALFDLLKHPWWMLYAKLFNCMQFLTFFTKNFIIDAWQNPKYTTKGGFSFIFETNWNCIRVAVRSDLQKRVPTMEVFNSFMVI